MKTKKLKKHQQITEYRRQVFFEKIEEYSKLTLEELKELFNHPEKKKRPGGIYREALIEVVRRKQIDEASKSIKDGVEELKKEEKNEESS